MIILSIKSRVMLIVFVLAAITTSYSQNGEWLVYTSLNSGLPNDGITTITIDQNGKKWIGNQDGLVTFDGTDWVIYDEDNSGLRVTPGGNRYAVSVITIDEDDTKWIGSRGGLTKYDGTDWTVYDNSNSGIYSEDVAAIAIDENGVKWIGTAGGLARFDGTDWTSYRTNNSDIPHNTVRAISIDKDGVLWLATQGGLATFDGTDWGVYNTDNSDLPTNSVFSLTIDDAGNKWAGTFSGLAKFDDTSWTIFTTSNSGMPDDWVYAVEATGTDIWVGLDYAGMAKFDGTDWTTYNTSNSELPGNWVYSIVTDGFGNKWIGTGTGLAVFNEDKIAASDGESGRQNMITYSVELQQNYPNPFNPVTVISYDLPAESMVRLEVFDLSGKRVSVLINERKSGGSHDVTFDAGFLSSGTYLYRLTADGIVRTRKMLMVK
ncbi:MAG: two-component regulator propeller domain-containing protein [Cyclonatronaceae bacterium]